MKEKNVTWDIDGVLAKSSDPVLRQIKEDFGIKIRTAQLTHFDAIYYIVYDETGSHDQGLKAISYFTRDDIILRSPTYPGQVFLVNLLDRMGYSQAAITSRPPQNRQMTQLWLEAHVPALSQNLFIRDPQTTLGGDDFKLDTIQNNFSRSLVLHVEDKDTTTDLLRRYRYPVALMDRPWNRDYDSNGSRHFAWPTLLLSIIRKSII